MSKLGDYYLQMAVNDKDFQSQLNSAIGNAEKKLFRLQNAAEIKMLLKDQGFLQGMSQMQSASQGFFSTLMSGIGTTRNFAGMINLGGSAMMAAGPAGIAAAAGIGLMSSAMQTAIDIGGSLATTVFNIGSALVEAGGKLEQYTISLGVMMKSEEAAARMVRELQAFAAVTPFDTGTLIASVQKLTQTGFSPNESKDMMRTIGDAAAAAPEGMEFAVKRLSKAFGDMKTANKLLLSDMRQFSEAGVGAVAILQKGFGMSFDDLRDKVKEGAISMDEVFKVLLKGMDDQFEGMMEKQSKGWVGMISTLKDNWEIFKQKVGEPLFEEAIKILTQMIDLLKSPEFDSFVVNMTAGMQTLVDVGRGMIDIYLQLLPILKAAAQYLLAMGLAAATAAGGQAAAANLAATAAPFMAAFDANKQGVLLDQENAKRKDRAALMAETGLAGKAPVTGREPEREEKMKKKEVEDKERQKRIDEVVAWETEERRKSGGKVGDGLGRFGEPGTPSEGTGRSPEELQKLLTKNLADTLRLESGIDREKPRATGQRMGLAETSDRVQQAIFRGRDEQLEELKAMRKLQEEKKQLDAEMLKLAKEGKAATFAP